MNSPPLVIGLEVHVQLRTQTKLFSRSLHCYGAPRNTLVDPHCLGLPGTLPILQERAVELALRLAAALGMEISECSRFDRKHYFYPDLPKNYQITQQSHPLARGGALRLSVDQGSSAVAIQQLHLEEDAARCLHQEQETLLDFNRAGAPLVEVVTDPVITDALQAGEFLREMRRLVRWIGVSDGNMNEGSLRCDANISLDAEGFRGVVVEVKNLNSIAQVVEALDFEAARLRRAHREGRCPRAQTRFWSPSSRSTGVLREKESRADYRYLPDPDLPPLRISPARIGRAVAAIGELPLDCCLRFQDQFGISEEHAVQLTQNRMEAEYFEQVARRVGGPLAASWILSELRYHLHRTDCTISDSPVSAEDLAQLLSAAEKVSAPRSLIRGQLSRIFDGESTVAGFGAHCRRHRRPEEEVRETLDRILKENAALVVDYRRGKHGVLDHLMGLAFRDLGDGVDARQLRQWCQEELEG